MTEYELEELGTPSLEELNITLEYLYEEDLERARNATTLEDIERAYYYGMQSEIVLEEDQHNW